MYSIHNSVQQSLQKSISYSMNQIIRKQRAVFFLSVFFMVASPNHDVYAWHTFTHPFLSELALNALPEDMRSVFAPYVQNIQWGAMEPDVTIKDWSAHELNIHGTSQECTDASTRIILLYDSIMEKLNSDESGGPIDYSNIAYEMGLISHYIADVCQPLHTDEMPAEDNFHVEYETDIYRRQKNFVFDDSGLRLIHDLKKYISENAGGANRNYVGIAKVYMDNNEASQNSRTRGITRLCMQKTVDAIRNIWATAWYQSKASGKNALKSAVALYSNSKIFRHGETIQMKISLLNKDFVRADSLSDNTGVLSNVDAGEDADVGLYVAMVDPAGSLWFLTSDSRFSQAIQPWRENLSSGGLAGNLNAGNVNIDSSSGEISEEILFKGLLWPETAEGEYHFYAAMLSPAPSSSFPSYNVVSNVSEITVTLLKSTTFSLTDLTDEIYLFPAIQEDTGGIIPLPLQRWDFIVLGEREDIPWSPDDERQHANIIPGRYNHLMIYIGRDRQGVPYGMEMTTFFDPEVYDFRLARLPEYDSFDKNSEAVPVPVVSKSLWSYATRWAKRLTEENLARIRQNEPELLTYLEKDWLNRIRYQVEYDWSGSLADTTVYLVDDGLERGAGCTDYWLSFFETYAGVCIQGSRISAQEIVSYFKNDPKGREALIPEELNPFPFSLYVRDLFPMGFKLVDSEPHVFFCEGSSETALSSDTGILSDTAVLSETGISIPDRLVQSPQLEEISPAPAVYDWP